MSGAMRHWRRTRSSHARVLEALEATIARHPSVVARRSRTRRKIGRNGARADVLVLHPHVDDDGPSAA
jgi:hypothetical protein